MTSQALLESRQERKPLLAQRGQIAADAAKAGEPLIRAKAARDFLLDFEHAQIALGLIVVKVDPQIFQEAEDRLLVFAQPVEQVTCSTLFDAPFAARGGLSLVG